MAKKKNRKCLVCGYEYFFCPSCNSKNEPMWKYLFHDENCKTIFNICSSYNAKDLTKDEAFAKINDCDLSNYDNFNKSIKVDIENISKNSEDN